MESSEVVSKYLFRLPMNRKSHQPRVIPTHIGELQADVMYLVDYGAWTGGYKYCLNVIDAYSRFVWSFPMKKLTKVEVKKDLIRVIQELEDTYHIPKDDISVTTDQGVEFHHQAGEHEAEEDFDIGSINLPVKHVVIHPDMGKGRTVLVERFNRTLHNALRKARFEDPHNRTGSVFLQHNAYAVNEYNQSIHTTTKVAPMDVLNKEVVPDVVTQNEVPKFTDGDVVLVVKKLGKFEKASSSVRYEPELWKVTGQIGWRYTLVPYEDQDGPEYEDTYGYNPLGSDLLRVKPEDVEAFVNYEKPQRVVQQIDDEALAARQQRQASRVRSQITYPSASQMHAITPTSSTRKNRVNYASYQ